MDLQPGVPTELGGRCTIPLDGWGATVAYSDAERAFNLAAVPGVDETSHLTTLNSGIFSDVSMPLTDRLSLSLGGRYIYDDIRIRNSNSAGISILSGRNSVKDSYFIGRAALGYE